MAGRWKRRHKCRIKWGSWCCFCLRTRAFESAHHSVQLISEVWKLPEQSSWSNILSPPPHSLNMKDPFKSSRKNETWDTKQTLWGNYFNYASLRSCWSGLLLSSMICHESSLDSVSFTSLSVHDPFSEFEFEEPPFLSGVVYTTFYSSITMSSLSISAFITFFIIFWSLFFILLILSTS